MRKLDKMIGKIFQLLTFISQWFYLNHIEWIRLTRLYIHFFLKNKKNMQRYNVSDETVKQWNLRFYATWG